MSQILFSTGSYLFSDKIGAGPEKLGLAPNVKRVNKIKLAPSFVALGPCLPGMRQVANVGGIDGVWEWVKVSGTI